MNPQNNDAFGSPNIAFENFNDNANQQLAPKDDKSGSDKNYAPINLINTNGLVSGQKVVDESWRKIAICAIVISVGCLLGVMVSVFLTNRAMTEANRLTSELSKRENELSSIYDLLGVTERGSALGLIASPEMLTGTDIQNLNQLMAERFGTDFKFDFSKAETNFVVKNGAYKILSLDVLKDDKQLRVIFYAKSVDGVWHIVEIDKNAEEDPCLNMSDSDKAALKLIDICRENKDAGVELGEVQGAAEKTEALQGEKNPAGGEAPDADAVPGQETPVEAKPKE